LWQQEQLSYTVLWQEEQLLGIVLWREGYQGKGDREISDWILLSAVLAARNLIIPQVRQMAIQMID
jgi:hypothetical protein